MAHAPMESSGNASRTTRPQRGQGLESSDHAASGVGPTGVLPPSRRLLSLALLVAVVLLALAPPMLAQPATVPPPRTAEDYLGPGWVALPWTIGTGSARYPEVRSWFAGLLGARVVLQRSKPPPWVFDDAWNGTVAVLGARKLLPKLPLTALQEKPAEPPPIEGCADVHRVQGLPVEFPVLLEAITACRTSDAILVATLSGAWQGQEGVVGSDALIRLLLDLRSSGGSMNGTATAGDRAALVPTPGAETPEKTPSPSRSLDDLMALFPSPEQLPEGMVLAEEGSLTASELAGTFADPADAAQVLKTWGWSANAYRVYVADPDAGPETPTRLEISLHQVSTNSMVSCATCGAAYALSYFADGRAVMLDQGQSLAPGMGPCEAAIIGENGEEVTVYRRYGNLLIRVTAAMAKGYWATVYYFTMPAAFATAGAVMQKARGSVQELAQTCQ
jgi:hypothetical protein